MWAALKHCKNLLETVPIDSKVKPTPLPFTKLPSFLGINRQEICVKCIDKLKVVSSNNGVDF